MQMEKSRNMIYQFEVKKGIRATSDSCISCSNKYTSKMSGRGRLGLQYCFRSLDYCNRVMKNTCTIVTDADDLIYLIN